MQATLDEVVAAYEKARARASVADDLLETTLHLAVFDLKESSASVRQISRRLHVPKSTVQRHLKGKAHTEPPVWGNREEYLRANRDVWSHAPENDDALLDFCPWEWRDTPEGREVRRLSLGTAKLRQDALIATPRPGKTGPRWASELDQLNRLNRLAGDDLDRRFMTVVAYLVFAEHKYPGQLPREAQWGMSPSVDNLRNADGSVRTDAVDQALIIAKQWMEVQKRQGLQAMGLPSALAATVRLLEEFQGDTGKVG